MIYYFIPAHNEASWGIGMLYQHVNLLKRNGFDATVVHEKNSVQMDWLDVDVPAISMQADSFKPNQRDFLVIPEVCANNPVFSELTCRKLVFVQGSFLMLPNLNEHENYKTLGFEHALVILPHMKTIVENHFGVPASVVPPFVAPYFFLDKDALINGTRKRRIIIYPKAGYIDAGLPDYEIVNRFLRRRLALVNKTSLKWELKELRNLTHMETAQLMQDSAYFINLNSLEGFNTTVPEAMAAGCIPVCYDAFGGRDFLQDGFNAHVFPNHYAYPLLEKVFELIDRYDQMREENLEIRKQARATASQYTAGHTERALLNFYRMLIT